MQNERSRKRSVLYFLLAVVVAVGIWFTADQTSNNGSPRQTEYLISDIPITYTGVDTDLADKGLMLVDDGTDASLDLKVTIGRLTGARMTADDVQVTADLSNIENAGTQTVQYSIRFLGDFSDAVTKREASISRATVNISELYSKVVDVKCQLEGNVADGYSAGELQLSAEVLEIRGQAEDIDPVSYVKVTLNLGEAATETVSEALAIQFYDQNDQLLDSAGIHPTVDTIQATLPVFVTKELQLAVNFKEYPGLRRENLNVSVNPPAITVSGDAAQLKNVDSIVLGTFDLMEFLDTGVPNHTYSIIIPDGCQNLSGVTRATLQVSFKDMVRMEVTADQFESVNIPEGKTVTILTEELPVNIFGASGDVEGVTAEDVTVQVDLSDYAAASGTYTVPATVKIASGDVGVSGSYQVRVTIQEDTPEE